MKEPARRDAPPGDGTLTGRLAWGSIMAFGIHVGGAGLTYCSQLVIARIVGAGSFGVYAYVFSWMTMLAYLSALGFDVAVLRFIPAYQAQESWPLLRGLIGYAERRAALVGFGVVAIGIAIVGIRAGDLPHELTQTFMVGFFLVPVWALLWIRCSVVRAFGGVVSALAPDRMVRDGVLLGIVCVLSVIPGLRIDATWAMAATLVSSAVGLALVTLAKHRRKPEAVGGVRPAYAGRTWSRAALPLVVIGVAEVVMNRTGVVLLGWIGKTTDAGIYALAFNISFMAALPRTAVNALFAPTISRLYVRNDRAALQALVTRTALWTLTGAACIALPLAFLAGPLMGWFGHSFVAGVPAMRILLLGQIVAAGAGSQLYLLTMTGHERSAAALMVASAAANAALGAVLVGPLGPAGAAIATTTALLAWNAAMATLIWRRLNVVPSVLALCRLPQGVTAWLAGSLGTDAGRPVQPRTET
jgi:O-antigen/teichoic acid export membrane protein